MTNKPNDVRVVPRELLVRINNLHTTGNDIDEELAEIRAILAQPADQQDDEGCAHEFIPFQKACAKCGELYSKAPVDQMGEPVAYQIRSKTDRPGSPWTPWRECTEEERAMHSCEAGAFNRFGIMRELRALCVQPATAKVPLPADWRSLADQLQAVGLAYWDAHHRERGSGAVKWLHNEETGALFVITRGEYASQVKDFVCSLDGVPTDQHGQPVAHCVERRNGSGEWINDAKSWVDGAPGREIVEYCAKYPELMRVRMAYAQPVTVRVDEALAIQLPGRLSFCRVADSPIDDKAGDLLDYDDTVAAIEAAGIKVKP